MKLNKELQFEIGKRECAFRTLTTNDVTEAYVEALKEQRKYLIANPDNISIEIQREYVQNILDSPCDTICGLFIDSELIGTSGIQNIGSEDSTTFGIFVLKKEMRGKGFGKTLVWASTYHINKCCGISYFEAGIEKDNIKSLKSFQACGYKIRSEDEKTYLVHLNINILIKPFFIS